MSTMKTCPRCGETKARTDFYQNASRPGGCASHCIACSRLAAKAAYAANRTTRRAYHRAWGASHRDPARRREQYLRTNYGMGRQSFEAMLAHQDHRCDLCGRELIDERGPGRIAIDHDHATGRVRGILHATCNVALGTIEDVGAEPFISYLKRHRLTVVA